MQTTPKYNVRKVAEPGLSASQTMLRANNALVESDDHTPQRSFSLQDSIIKEAAAAIAVNDLVPAKETKFTFANSHLLKRQQSLN